MTSLIEIQRGGVRIEKNPVLCFVDTIDWSLITWNSEENVLGKNRAPSECPICFSNYDSELPKSSAETTAVRPVSFERRSCWNRKQSQLSEYKLESFSM